jgi:hypothetical protein
VRKPRRSICAQKILLDLVNQKTKNAGDGYRKKPIEKTFLRLLGSHTFSHGLDPKRPFLPLGNINEPHHASGRSIG